MFKLWFQKRPDIDEQNTGHLAFQRPMGFTTVGYNGMNGITSGSLSPIYPGTFMPYISLVKRDPTVTGNPNTNLEVEPLTEQTDLQIAMLSANRIL